MLGASVFMTAFLWYKLGGSSEYRGTGSVEYLPEIPQGQLHLASHVGPGGYEDADVKDNKERKGADVGHEREVEVPTMERK